MSRVWAFQIGFLTYLSARVLHYVLPRLGHLRLENPKHLYYVAGAAIAVVALGGSLLARRSSRVAWGAALVVVCWHVGRSFPLVGNHIFLELGAGLRGGLPATSRRNARRPEDSERAVSLGTPSAPSLRDVLIAVLWAA